VTELHFSNVVYDFNNLNPNSAGRCCSLHRTIRRVSFNMMYIQVQSYAYTGSQSQANHVPCYSWTLSQISTLVMTQLVTIL